jgi:hypothetical protein
LILEPDNKESLSLKIDVPELDHSEEENQVSGIESVESVRTVKLKEETVMVKKAREII